MKNGDTKKVLAASIYAVHQIGGFSGLICVSDRNRMISAPVLLTETDKEEAAMMKKESFRRILIRVFWCSLIFTLGFSWIYIRYAVPDKLNLVINEEEVFHFSLPPGITFESDSEEVILKNSSDIPDGMIRIDRPDSVSMCGKNEGSYLVGMKFLGLILMKEIQVDVVDSSCAIPCGTPVGIYLSSKGVMVIGTGQVTNKTGNVVEPAYGLLKSGDYIQTINGETLEDKDALVDAVNASGGKAMILGIRRDGREIDVNMTPVLADDGHYKLGAWVRDDTQGIGTMTYVDMNGASALWVTGSVTAIPEHSWISTAASSTRPRSWELKKARQESRCDVWRDLLRKRDKVGRCDRKHNGRNLWNCKPTFS